MDSGDTHRELTPSGTESDLPGDDSSHTVEVENETSDHQTQFRSEVMQTAVQADIEIRYAKATVRFRETKADYEEARRDLVEVVTQLGNDPSNLLSERLAYPFPTFEIPLPMTFGELKLYMKWTDQKANAWLKYRLNTGVIKKRGTRGKYVYYYPNDPTGERYGRPRG